VREKYRVYDPDCLLSTFEGRWSADTRTPFSVLAVTPPAAGAGASGNSGLFPSSTGFSVWEEVLSWLDDHLSARQVMDPLR